MGVFDVCVSSVWLYVVRSEVPRFQTTMRMQRRTTARHHVFYMCVLFSVPPYSQLYSSSVYCRLFWRWWWWWCWQRKRYIKTTSVLSLTLDGSKWYLYKMLSYRRETALQGAL